MGKGALAVELCDPDPGYSSLVSSDALAQAFAAIPALVYALDREHRIVAGPADVPNRGEVPGFGQATWRQVKGVLDRVLEQGCVEELHLRGECEQFPHGRHLVAAPWSVDGVTVGTVLEVRDAGVEEAALRQRNRDLEAQLRQEMKLRALGALTAGVAHDFNTLMTVVRMYADFALEALSPDSPAATELDQVLSAADKATALTRQLLRFTRRDPQERKDIRLDAVVQEFAPMLRRLLGASWQLRLSIAEQIPPVLLDRSEIESAILNLVVNARDASPPGGSIELEVHSHASGRVSLVVRDHGIGMTPEVAARVFEPYFTTKPAERGTGVGLSWVSDIVEAAGGSVELHSAPGEGTTISLHFQAIEGQVSLSDDMRSEPLAPLPAEEPPSKRGRVLIVDDEDQIRALIRRTLEASGFTTVVASSGDEALSHLDRGGSFDLLVVDVVMPGIGGPALVEEMRRVVPTIPVVFLSALAVDGGTGTFVGEPFLSKPFRPADLVRLVQDRVGAKRVERATS